MKTIVCLLTLFLASRVIAQSPISAESSSDCEISAVSINNPGSFVYYPFSPQDEVRRVEVLVSSAGDCRLGLGLLAAGGAGLLGSGSQIALRFTDTRGQLIRANGTPHAAIETAATRQGHLLSFLATIPADQLSPAGDYSNNFQARVFANGSLLREVDFELSAYVAGQATLRLAGSGRGGLGHAAGLDFGVLETGEERVALMSVRSNAAYALNVSSENAGVLKNTSSSRVSEFTSISYRAWLDNQLLQLSSGIDMHRYSAPGRTERLTDLRVKIGDTRNRFAGTYRDTLRVTVTLLE